MANLGLTVLSLLLGIIFLFLGIMILTQLNENVHNELVKDLNRSVSVFLFAHKTGFKPDPELAVKVVGTIDFVGGLVLAFVPGSLKLLADIMLMILMVTAMQTHYSLDDDLRKAAPAIILFFLLLVHFFLARRAGREHKVVHGSAQSTKKKAH